MKSLVFITSRLVHAIARSSLALASYYVRFARRHIARRELVLLACMPKSGSTYISEKIAELEDWRRVHFVPEYGEREQELSEWSIVKALLRYPNENLIAQAHVCLSPTTARIIRKFDIKCIVLTRNIEDAVLSLRDFKYNDTNLSPLSIWNYDLFESARRNGVDPLAAVAFTSAGWYVKFFTSWTRFEEFSLGDQVLPLKYRQFFEDERRGFDEIAAFLGIDAQEISIDSELLQQRADVYRFNKGGAGRGVAEVNRDGELRALFDKIYACYPDLDFDQPIDKARMLHAAGASSRSSAAGSAFRQGKGRLRGRH